MKKSGGAKRFLVNWPKWSTESEKSPRTGSKEADGSRVTVENNVEYDDRDDHG